MVNFGISSKIDIFDLTRFSNSWQKRGKFLPKVSFDVLSKIDKFSTVLDFHKFLSNQIFRYTRCITSKRVTS